MNEDVTVFAEGGVNFMNDHCIAAKQKKKPNQ